MPKQPPSTRRMRFSLAVLTAAAAMLTACSRDASSPFQGASAPSDQGLLDLIRLSNRNTPEQLVDDALNEFDPDDRARGLAGIAARPFGADPVFVDLYRGSTTDNDAAVRAAAARALGLHGEPADAALLAPLLDDPDRLVRWHAARALQRLHNPAAVNPLIARLDESREDFASVRTAAATALAQYPQPRVLDALVAALDDTDLAVNTAARRSLATLTGASLGSRPEDWVAFIRDSPDPFAGREPFRYPAFERDARWFELINPWDEVPREASATPAGMPAIENRPAPTEP